MENARLKLLALWRRMFALWVQPDGFATAELLGNAAMAIVALIAIWGALKLLGIDILTVIHNKLLAQLP